MLARDQVGGERSATAFRPSRVQFCDQQINFHELMHFSLVTAVASYGWIDRVDLGGWNGFAEG